MKKHPYIGGIIAGFAAGAVAGLFGAGGGLVLVPLLTLLTSVKEDALFPTSLSIMIPVCVVSLTVTALTGKLYWQEALPYLMGSAVGGVFSGIWGQKIPAKWLHRALGILILWGGCRYLC